MPSLNVIQGPAGSNVLLQYKRALALWSSHCADEAVFGGGAVYANRKLSQIAEANCMHGEMDDAAVSAALGYFQQASVSPLAWYMPGPSPVAADLRDVGIQLWRLDSLEHALPVEHRELTIIPARASFAHVGAISQFMRPGTPPDQALEAVMCHLDDARVDALVALWHGEAAAYGSVISTGEAGFVMELFVREDLRRRGMGSTMAGRILDICARSLFKVVYCATREGDAAQAAFARHAGFSPAATIVNRAI